MLRRAFLLLAVLFVIAPITARADVFATITGSVFEKITSYGPYGSITSITLVVDTWDGTYWQIICRRQESNLSKCNVINEQDSIIGNGQLLPIPGYPVSSGWLSPTSISRL